MTTITHMSHDDPGDGGPPPYFNFADHIFDRWARERPDSSALWHVDPASGVERRFSFREIASLSRRAANFLARSGIGRGDRVLVMLHRVPEWWIAMLGLIRLGAVPIPGTLLLTPREVAFRLSAASATAVLADAEGADKVTDFAGSRILVGGSRHGWFDFCSGIATAPEDFSPVPTRSDDPGILFFTSATTGEPKMVLHTQASYGWAHRITGALWLDLGPDDVHWNLSDLGWGKAAWSSFYGPWHQGACVFAIDRRGKFDAVATLDTLERFPITTWCAPPTALRLIVREDLSTRHFPELRHCVTAGEPLNPEVFQLWKDATGLALHEAYGQTETVVLIGNFRSLAHEIRPGSMGRPAPGFDVALLDDDLVEVPVGHEGQIAIRVKPTRPTGLCREYWLNDEETARQFQGEWYLTGDRATRDAEGNYWFIGRKDDIIKSSGYRIGPFEVESALLEHPSVLEAGVVAKPDDVRGQIVKAYVVLRPGFTAGDALAAELQGHCKRTASPYKYPREIEFVQELPKTISGKVRHVDLRKRARAEIGA
ncbi:MAG TPA: AMP-binding protein [Verrucomicrobiae bacterium]|nr:AMP-binding protein [Verrucomicrobiae bacterium]